MFSSWLNLASQSSCHIPPTQNQRVVPASSKVLKNQISKFVTIHTKILLPSAQNGYNMRCIPKSPTQFSGIASLKDFPETSKSGKSRRHHN